MNRRWLAVGIAFWAVTSMAAQAPAEKLPVFDPG